MNQHITEKRLIAFVDNEVSGSEYVSILDHLKNCNQCTFYVEQMRSIFTDLGRLETAPAQPDMIRDTITLLRSLKRTEQPSRFFFKASALKKHYRLLTIGTVAAGLAVGILFGDMARQGFMQDSNGEQIASVVLQENDTTINDIYVSLIINHGQDDL